MAQLNDLTAELQQHLNKLNFHTLPIQTFTESVLEIMDVYDKDVELWLLRSQGRIFGYLLSFIDQHPFISAMIIGSQYREQGLGEKLIQSARAARKNEAMKVVVLKNDAKAISFYHRAGGFFDYDHLSRYTHLVIFPPLRLDRSEHALSRESELGTQGQTVDH